MAIVLEKNIDGILHITPHIYEDERGVYKKYFEKEDFFNVGILLPVSDKQPQSFVLLCIFSPVEFLAWAQNPVPK